MKQRIQLSDHFTSGRLLRFTAPSIGMMLFTSIYGVVDGFFVSNYVGKTAFAAVNLIIPYLMIIGGFGAMLGVGGSALVAKTLGEGDERRASRYFTMMIELMVLSSVALAAIGIAILRPVGYLFGATEHMIGDVVTYGTVCLLFSLGMHAQYTLQSYLIAAEQPKLALYIVVAAGFSNMILDYLLMAVFVGYDKNLLDMTSRAFMICATPFLIMWFNLYTSSFFTALNDGMVSAAISFMRALVLPVICILVMPTLWQLDGVWYSLVASEVLSIAVSLFFLLGKRKKYGY